MCVCVCVRAGRGRREEERAAGAPQAPCAGAGTGPPWSDRLLPPALPPRRPLCGPPPRGAEERGRQEEPPSGEGLALGARLPGAGSGEMAAGRARRLLGSLWIALLLGQPDPAGAAARSGSQSLLAGKEPGKSRGARGGCAGAAGAARGRCGRGAAGPLRSDRAGTSRGHCAPADENQKHLGPP